MKAKYKIGMLLSYKTEADETIYGIVKAVINHEDHADYLMEDGSLVTEEEVASAYIPVGGKKSPKKPRKPKVKAPTVEE